MISGVSRPQTPMINPAAQERIDLPMHQQTYHIERDRRVLVARPVCVRCTGTDIADLIVELCRRIDQGEADSVVVELSNVQHMDSSCISRLLVLRQHTRNAGGSVALARCQPNVAFLFRMTRLDRALGLYDTAEDAVAELRDRRTRPKPDLSGGRESKRQRGYAPLLAALLRAHRRFQPGQELAPAKRPHPHP